MTTDPAELWAPIPGAPGYEASTLGRVRSPGRPGGLRPARQSKGYLKVNLGRARQEYVHRLVMEAHRGPCPAGYEVDHVDFDRTNNRLENLRYLRAEVNRWRWEEHGADRADDVEPMTGAELAEIEAATAAAGW